MRPFLLFYFFVSVLATVTVLPSNNSQDLSWSSSVRFRLQASGSLNGLALAPLTESLVRLTDSEKEAFHISGNVTRVVAEDSVGLNSSSIACIPCDSSDYPGPLKADRTIDTVDSQSTLPGAIILYSSSASHCNLTTDDIAESYRNIFTVINSRSSTLLQAAFGSNNTLAAIGSMSAPVTGVDTNTGTGTGTGGDSPNTAMIILYSITGIITALFLGIIITGAVRAHRHPERYGPRRVAGRIRQSRARGIARAMLETIPIVKFGDESPGDGVDAAKRDVEMVNHESGHEPGHEHSPRSESIADVETTPRETDLPEQESDHPIAAAPEHKTDATPDAGNFSCPICTDDFVKGQDLRVLPCQHQFHLECIDPWLVNVSGTCPLCRIDLNPPKEEENAEQGENAEHTEETPAEEAGTSTDATTHRHSHHRLTNYLNARRMHNATVEERLAALRHVRAANQGNATDAIPAASRQRLSTRLRERFRIRSRTHGVESLSPGESGATTPTPTTPTVPAPAHIAETETETEPQTNETAGLPTNPSR